MSQAEQKRAEKKISTGAISGSRKIYVKGTRYDINVAMREIVLSPTKQANGQIEYNAPVTVYDTGGPFTDDAAVIDIKKGLPRIREQWILDRNDVEQLQSVSSDFGKDRR
ncbi:MAG: phosphomethylpyrimidine synthase ThiC, partial [Bacteroidia bacterium]|nr:phosphomethylpyrimidine synthase ThiC [Bacteroidia bacterium]